jgi:hypothetical protein
MKSLLNPPASVGAAIGTMGIVIAIYAITVPNMAEIHATDPHDPNIDRARKKAAITAGVAAGAVSILSKDLNPWILGGGAIIVSDMFVRHANVTSPVTGAVVADTGYGQTVPNSGQYATQLTQPSAMGV